MFSCAGRELSVVVNEKIAVDGRQLCVYSEWEDS